MKEKPHLETKAPRVYKSGDYLWLVFDSTSGSEQTHSTSFPCTEKGFQAMCRVLDAIERSPFKDRTIGTEASPIQHMIDKWLQEGNEIKKIGLREADEELTLEDLDL